MFTSLNVTKKRGNIEINILYIEEGNYVNV